MTKNNKILHTILSSILGLMFLFSAFSKIYDIKEFTYTVLQYNILVFVYGIPFLIILEVFLGAELLLNLNVKRNSLIAGVFLFFVSIIFAYGYFVKDISDCGCFGNSLKMSPFVTFVRNILLIAISVYLFLKTENKKANKKLQFIAIIILGFGVFFSGNYFRLPSNMKLVKPEKPQGKDISKTEFAQYYKFDKDTTYMIFVFSYMCPHCLNSIENAKQYQKFDKIDKTIFFGQGSEGSKKEFFKYFDLNGITYFDAIITDKTAPAFPTTFIVKDNEIILIHTGELPAYPVFIRYYNGRF